MLIKITDEPDTDFFEIDCDELEFPNLIKNVDLRDKNNDELIEIFNLEESIIFENDECLKVSFLHEITLFNVDKYPFNLWKVDSSFNDDIEVIDTLEQHILNKMRLYLLEKDGDRKHDTIIYCDIEFDFDENIEIVIEDEDEETKIKETKINEPKIMETIKFIEENLKVHYTYETVSKNTRLKKLLNHFETQFFNYFDVKHTISLNYWGKKSRYDGVRGNKIKLKEEIIIFYTDIENYEDH